MNRQIIVIALLALVLTSPAAAQQPLAVLPTTPTLFARYDFHLSAAALANADTRFSWDTHFGGDIDVFDYVVGRTSAIIHYQAVLGSEFRPFDPTQGNYILEVASSYRIGKTEVAAMFHHVSRHLSDRPKVFPIAWNILGVRVLRRQTLKNATIDVVAEFGGATQKAHVDYNWTGNLDLVVRHDLHPRVSVFARGAGHLMGVDGAMLARHTQSGGEVEGGIRLNGEMGAAELFAGFERRFDADPLDFKAQRWFMTGFRFLRR